MKIFVRCAAVTGLMLATPLALAGDWVHGISTGIGSLAMDGDLGFDSRRGQPVDVDVDLDAGDVQDAMSSALGLGGFSRSGDLTITYGASMLELEGDTSAVRGEDKLKAELDYKSIGAEIIADFIYAKKGNNSFGVIAGVRYTEKEFDTELKLNGDKLNEGHIDENWTDVVVGLSHTYAFSPTLAWRTGIDYGFGGSDGTTHFRTGVRKLFAESWQVGLNVEYNAVDFENGTRGTGNWFKYDIEETKVVLGVSYIFR